MKLSVIIVNYNVKYFLEQCLDAVYKAIERIQAEVFVVDNNSSDGSLAYLEPKFPEAIFIRNTDNPGFSKANNQAMREAKGEYILLLNPDTVVGEQTLEQTCLFMDQHPDAGGVGVKMIDGNGEFLPESKRGFPSPWNSFCKMFGLSKVFPSSPIFARYHLRFLDSDNVHDVDVLAGAYMLLRRETLDKIGLLDETFFMYGEDIDLSYRIRLGGYKNYYVPERIIHYKGESTKKDIRYIRIFYEAMSIFFKKHYPHYSKLYNFFINAAIRLKASMDIIKNAVRPEKKKTKVSRKNILILGDNKSCRELSDFYEKSGNTGIINCIDPQKDNNDREFISQNNYNEVVFSKNCMKYEEIISIMDTVKKKQSIYKIYHPENRIIIAPGESAFI